MLVPAPLHSFCSGSWSDGRALPLWTREVVERSASRDGRSLFFSPAEAPLAFHPATVALFRFILHTGTGSVIPSHFSAPDTMANQ